MKNHFLLLVESLLIVSFISCSCTRKHNEPLYSIYHPSALHDFIDLYRSDNKGEDKNTQVRQMLYSAFLSLCSQQYVTPCFIWVSALETLCHLLFPSPSSLWHFTSKQQLGITEAINDHFSAHLPALFWQLLNGKHMIYWQALDSNVHKFNSLPLKDRLIQFSSAFLQATESRTATGRGAIKTPSWIIIWISLELWIVPPVKLTGEKKQLNLLKSCKIEL